MKALSKKKKLEHILEYLKRNKLMTLGTVSKNKPWAATVFFAYDDRANIVFISREDTKHCAHIKNNQNVSVVINHDWKHSNGSVKGLQMQGIARKPTGAQAKKYLAIHRKRFPWAKEFSDSHSVYVIKPLELWLIDEKKFGHFYRVQMI